MNSPKDAVNELKDQLKEDLENLKKEIPFQDELKENKEKLTKLIQEYPLTSVAIAAGLGIIIGRLLSSRK